MKILNIFFVAETIAFTVYGPIAYGPIKDWPLIKVFCGDFFANSSG